MDDASAVMAYERLMLYKISGKSVHQQLEPLLPKLMDTNFLFPPNSVSKRFFAMLLGHAATEKESLRNEVMWFFLV
jgi:hypothetical protein